MRVIQNTYLTIVSSKLNTKYFCLCKLLKVRGSILTLRKRNTKRIFAVNYDSTRALSLSHLDALPYHASHDLQTSIPLSNNSEINRLDVSQN